MKKIRLTIQYDGTNYLGWQRQPKGKTIAGTIETALKKITGEDVTLIGSGRTDSGVHALKQTAAFTTSSAHEPDVFMKALNSTLPFDIKITTAATAALNFHPQYDAKSKTYFYLIYNSEVLSPFFYRYCCHLKRPLDIIKMTDAAQCFIGKKDFKSFTASDSDIKTTVREIFSLNITVMEHVELFGTMIDGDFIKITITANGFLRHMVRNIVGTLVDAGYGKVDTLKVIEIINGCDRTLAGKTMPAKGLFLEDVFY
ncbi:tRNA pseudouridine(38-40) synthase TruA [Candidatus Magnetomonas plexicatena]|nr:tRNA pseudouridine(38-40) synthase TruA [Nitrospirales bacterium LBB_01]